jgi:hypothetical protein
MGIQTLISSGLIEEGSTLADVLWRDAMFIMSVESLEVLLPFRKHISLGEWNYLNLQYRMNGEDSGQTGSATRWNALFHHITARLLSPITLNPHCQSPIADKAKTEIPTPYHCYHLSSLGANSAWMAGFRDLKSARWKETTNNNPEYGTPLWLSLRYICIGWLDVIEWLLDHGADPFWIHPTFLTTPANIIARAADLTWRRDSKHLLTTKQCDKCICNCSQGGCHIIGCSISENFRESLHSPPASRLCHRRTVQPYLFNLVDENIGANWMSSAIFRVLTFEALSLTHTCCYRISEERCGSFSRPTRDEAEVIYDHERDDINLLDTLVKEFEAQWTNYNKPFVTFMNRVWRPRMRRVRQVKDEEAYAAEVRRLGVVLKSKDASADSDSDSDWPDDYVSEDEDDGWHTADEEDANEGEEN